jgi:putative transposase
MKGSNTQMLSNNIIPNITELQRLVMNGNEDFLREMLSKMLNMIMELEVSAKNNASKHERTENRKAYRNGTRQRPLSTGVGVINLQIPKLRTGESYFPSFIEPRRLVEKALLNVIQEAYINGVSTRKVDKIVEEMGIHIDKSAVSRICKELDAGVEAFRNRPLTDEYPYVWLDATFPKVREGGRVQGMAFVTAIAVNDDGTRQILGFDIGMSESGAFWDEFLRSLVRRGLKGVKLVISDAHEGLKNAIFSILPGSSWQRCRVHCMRNILCHVNRKQQGMVSAMVRTVFAQESLKEAKSQLRNVVAQLKNHFPKAMEVLEDAEEEILTYMDFPKSHHPQIHSTNPLERLNKEIRRRSNVVSIFPNRAAVIRLIGSVLMEYQDEWLAAEKRYMSLDSMSVLKSQFTDTLIPCDQNLLLDNTL